MRSARCRRGVIFAKITISPAVLVIEFTRFTAGEGLNYTRDWPSGSYWLVGRVSTDVGTSGSLTVSRVNADSSTTDLGTFYVSSGLGWSTFQNVILKDTNGNNAVITLNGKATLRVTSGGNLL